MVGGTVAVVKFIGLALVYAVALVVGVPPTTFTIMGCVNVGCG